MTQLIEPGAVKSAAVKSAASGDYQRASESSPHFNPPSQVRLQSNFDRRGVMKVAEGSKSLFSSASWIGVIEDTYGFKVKASTLVCDGQVRAAILFTEVDDIRGRRVISLPFSDYCDPLVNSSATWQALLTPVLDLGVPVRFRTLRSDLPACDPRLYRTGSSFWHGVDLSRPEEQIWTSLRDNARQNIRKAERSDVTIREGRTLEDVRTFYRMHSNLRKTKYRMFAQPFSFFENIHAAFSSDDRVLVLLAEQNGVAIAGILFLVHEGTLYYKFNASTETALRPNDLLIWTGMKIGQRFGLSRLDFGVSDTDQPGLVRFKRKFATEERTVAYMTWIPPDHHDRRAEEVGRLLGQLTNALTSSAVDSSVTRSVGDIVYRYFC
jgi:CelD/BcsL family acetyltransferase involved in cellulose biosynthesis